jgi:hypothetical protein
LDLDHKENFKLYESLACVTAKIVFKKQMNLQKRIRKGSIAGHLLAEILNPLPISVKFLAILMER